ncbi:MAG: ABC transporter substrate-binding protein [Actinomycetota bacterium]
MRRLRLELALASGIAVALAACATGAGVAPDPSSATTSTSPPVTITSTTAPVSAYGGTVVVGVGEGGSPRTLNPFLDGADTAVLDLIAPAVFAKGYDVDPVTMGLVPNVLQSIPSVDDGTVSDLGDGTLQVTVTVAAGARWADGVPITADDLAFTAETAANPALPIRVDLARRYGLIVPASLGANGRTLTFRMQASTEYELLFDLIIPRHDVEGSDFGEAWNSTMWVAGGPFQFASWTPGQTLELTRNDNYWRITADGAALPFLDRVIFRFFEPGPSPDPRLHDAFVGAEIDVVTLAHAEKAAADYEGLDGVDVVSGPGLSWEYLNFQFGPANRNEGSLNRHLTFRRAIAFAIDRNALASERGTTPLASVLGPYGTGFTATPWDRYAYDPAKTASLLEEVGTELGVDLSLGSGPPVVITVSEDDAPTAALAGQIVTMLRAAGFDAQLQLEDAALFFGPTLDNGSWDVSVGRFTAGPGIARAVALAEIFDPAGLPFVGDNFFRWGTIDSTVSGTAVDEYAALGTALHRTGDPATAESLVIEAEGILVDQVVIIPLVLSERVGLAYRPGELSGPATNAAEGAMWNVAEWTRQVPGDTVP